VVGPIIEYSVVRGENSIKLAKNVGLALADGFQPIGGVAVTDEGFYQAVVKYEPAPSVWDRDRR
jgi:hypothetical protein